MTALPITLYKLMFVEAPTPCLKKAPNFAKGDTAFCFFKAINDRPYNIKNALPGVFLSVLLFYNKLQNARDEFRRFYYNYFHSAYLI